MNLKERNELRRRFSPDRSSIKQIFGCYVNSNREIISWLDLSLGLMGQEESEMYLSLLKKCLSGTAAPVQSCTASIIPKEALYARNPVHRSHAHWQSG